MQIFNVLDVIKIIATILCIVLFIAAKVLLNMKKKGLLNWNINNPYKEAYEKDLKQRVADYNASQTEEISYENTEHKTMLNGEPIN